jgi:CDP-diglyceride synthetase
MLYVIWLIFVLTVVAIHLYIIKKEKRSPDKAFWLAARIVFALLILYTEYRLQERNLILVGITLLSSGWFLHNTLIALGLRRKPWYVNNTGPMDKAIAGNTWIWFLMLIAFLTSSVMYFLNEVPV